MLCWTLQAAVGPSGQYHEVWSCNKPGMDLDTPGRGLDEEKAGCRDQKYRQ